MFVCCDIFVLRPILRGDMLREPIRQSRVASGRVREALGSDPKAAGRQAALIAPQLLRNIVHQLLALLGAFAQAHGHVVAE